ncbi:lecithin retinol acyltransferase family protein [Cupriavidus sp. WKF15]|uniref:lecithin retinol acyltransferase family protein n=1 Tax=Cupriavidus sp. WKF15 TaxID=3032282 RepID=UPI0023E13EF0|nr:lecithin retinol acyltransferase family protein [Cupriavidus sp. WKF15]WER44690.1 lecithin retinol acyltransferase family protein [Cupriavidus sp. WKF15]
MNDDRQCIESVHDLAATAEALFPGAHLVTHRRGYVHHGIYAGNGEVVHYVGFKEFLRCGPVETTSLADFASGFGFSVETGTAARYVGAEVVRRAKSRIGEDNYRLLTNNCEHFCTWCLFGEDRSQQVEALVCHPWRAMNAIIGVLLGVHERTVHESTAGAW